MARGAARTMGKEWAAVLADLPLFDGLSKRQLGKIAGLGVARRLPPLTSIVTKGDTGDAFFVIITGKAVVRRTGRRNVPLGPGDFFGEMALLDGAPRTATVEATSEVEVMLIPRSAFRKMLRSEPAIAVNDARDAGRPAARDPVIADLLRPCSGGGCASRCAASGWRSPTAALGWLQSAWACCITGEQCFEIALAVFAYKEGGIAAAGTLALVRAAVSALTAPLTAGLGDRFRRQTVLVANGAVLTVIVAGTIAFAAAAGETVRRVRPVARVRGRRPGLPAGAVGAAARRRPLARAADCVERRGLAAGGPGRPRRPGDRRRAAGDIGARRPRSRRSWCCSPGRRWRRRGSAAPPTSHGRRAIADGGGGALHEALEGIRETVRNPGVRVLVGLYTTSMLVWGAFFQVLVVVIAIQRLDIGEGGAGLLAAVTGVGAMICAAAAASLVGRRRLAPALAVGVACWALPLAVMAVTHSPVVAAVVATLIGAGVVLVDVVTFTLLQRAAPDDVLARVFGVLESAMRAALGIGAVAVPALVAATDLAITLAIVAAVQPIALVIAWPRLRAVDSIDLVPTERITLLQSVAMFAPLPALPLERLAARLVAPRGRRPARPSSARATAATSST